MKKLPAVTLQVINNENKEMIDDALIYINNKEYEVNEYGIFKLKPNYINEFLYFFHIVLLVF